MKSTINDIHSYTVFANIDKGNDIIEGHQIIIPKLNMYEIKDIISQNKIRVIKEPTYKVIENKNKESLEGTNDDNR